MKHRTGCIAIAASLIAALRLGAQEAAVNTSRRLRLAPCHLQSVDADARCGTYWVFENRARARGRRIPLRVIVLPSRSAHPAADPMLLVSPGGPGTTNSEEGVLIGYYSWWRDDRDVVIIDLRGTSGPDRLDCDLPGSGAYPGGYLDSLFPVDAISRCAADLSRNADLRQYTTPAIVDDLDQARAALGYREVNLWGASWGTRAVLFYLERHPEHIRSAILEGVAPPSLENPLDHARTAQMTVDSIVAGCRRQPTCEQAYPNPAADLATILGRLRRQPATVLVPRGHGLAPDTAALGWQQFAEALRVMTYRPDGAARVPMLLHQVAAGDFGPFVQAAVESNAALQSQIRFGFLLSVTCTEDVSRITPAQIPPATRGTYLGDSRVRAQMRACALWPTGARDAGYGDPIRSSVPVFLLSGAWDPVTPPFDGADAARYLSRSIHVVAPGGHVPRGPCIAAMERAFLAAASPDAVDTRCVARMRLPDFVVETQTRAP